MNEDRLDPTDFEHNLPHQTEDDIPTEVAPRPEVSSNPSSDDGAEDRKPAEKDVLERPFPTAPTSGLDDRLLPALVMVGVVGVFVILIATVSLLTR